MGAPSVSFVDFGSAFSRATLSGKVCRGAKCVAKLGVVCVPGLSCLCPFSCTVNYSWHWENMLWWHVPDGHGRTRVWMSECRGYRSKPSRIYLTLSSLVWRVSETVVALSDQQKWIPWCTTTSSQMEPMYSWPAAEETANPHVTMWQWLVTVSLIGSLLYSQRNCIVRGSSPLQDAADAEVKCPILLFSKRDTVALELRLRVFLLSPASLAFFLVHLPRPSGSPRTILHHRACFQATQARGPPYRCFLSQVCFTVHGISIIPRKRDLMCVVKKKINLVGVWHIFNFLATKGF